MFDLEDPFENIGRQYKACEKIFIHPEWNPFTKKFDADLAIIQTEDVMYFNKYVTPICLWGSQNLVSSGTVVGYGQSENKSRQSEPIPSKVEVSVIDFVQCIYSDPLFIDVAAPKTFCAKASEGRGVCKGDSGSGLIFKQNNKYFLLGIVSSSLKDDEDQCDITKFTVYTSIYEYKDWIENPSNEDLSHSKIDKEDLRTCKNGQNIPLYLMCDGKTDCWDKSDEERCGE
jgi:secreted trypsin-like serine protease